MIAYCIIWGGPCLVGKGFPMGQTVGGTLVILLQFEWEANEPPDIDACSTRLLLSLLATRTQVSIILHSLYLTSLAPLPQVHSFSISVDYFQVCRVPSQTESCIEDGVFFPPLPFVTSLSDGFLWMPYSWKISKRKMFSDVLHYVYEGVIHTL